VGGVLYEGGRTIQSKSQAKDGDGGNAHLAGTVSCAGEGSLSQRPKGERKEGDPIFWHRATVKRT